MSRAAPRALVVLAALSAALPLVASLARGDDGVSHPPAGVSPEEEIRRASAELASLRGRAFTSLVSARSMTAARASSRLLEIARLEGARCSPDVERAVVALGFVEGRPLPEPAAGSARREDQDGGGDEGCGVAFYDQISKEVVLVTGRSNLEERSEVLAHELSHALQDQLFDLRSRLRTIRRTASGDHDSEELAANAGLNEGEATLLELLSIWRRGADRSWIQGVSLGDPFESSLLAQGSFCGRGRADRLADGVRAVRRGAKAAWERQRALGARRYFQTLGRFEYLVGASFVAEAYLRGGWERVDELRSDPPVSTAQLLHAERFFAGRREPEAVPASAWLERRPGCRLLYENRMGELGLSIAAEGGTEGWTGDLERVCARSDGSVLLESRSLWEDPASARGFARQAARWERSMRLGTGSIDAVERRGRAVALCCGARPSEVAGLLESAWRERTGDDFSGAAATAGPADRGLFLRVRGKDGAWDCELELVGAGERERASRALEAHLDRTREGSLSTDGKTWGMRSREGGGVSWVEVRPGGRVAIATARDRTALRVALAALSDAEGARP